MSRFTQTVRSRMEQNRNRREIARAIDSAATPAMRQELILMAQRHGTFLR